MRGIDKIKDDKLKVLALKLQGRAPDAISKELELPLHKVMRLNDEIKRDMAKESKTELANIKPEALNDLMVVAEQLMPFMSRSSKKVRKAEENLRPLHEGMVEGAEIMISILKRDLNRILESEEETDLDRMLQLKEILTDVYQAFFNKNGIQVINMIQNGGLDGAAQEKQDIMDHLKDELNVIEAEIKETK